MHTLGTLWVAAFIIDGFALFCAVVVSLTTLGGTAVITAPLWAGVIIFFNYAICRGAEVINRP